VDHQRNRRAQRAPVPDAAQDLQVVGFEAHARRAAMAKAPPSELMFDRRTVDDDARG
jgi:hypothetical protein